MAVASLVLGIVSIVAAIFGLGIPVGVICGIIGIILGTIGRTKTPEKAGLAKGGLVCSVVGTVLSVLFIIACASCITSLGLVDLF